MPWRETCAMEERVKLMVEYDRGEVTFAELCRWHGVSRKTGYKWLARWRVEGVDGLSERSRAPQCCPHSVADEVVAALLAVKQRYPSWGPRKVKAYQERRDGARSWPAASTIGDLFGRAGLVVGRRKRQRTPARTQPLAHAGCANAVWSVDLKGWFRTGDGAICEPLTIADGCTRYLLRCQAVHRHDAGHVWPVFEAAFREYGLPERVRSDNGAPFAGLGAGGLSPLAVSQVKAGVEPERIDPGQPQQNGRHERLHLTLKQETATPPARSLRAQGWRFAAFQRIYNEERPHEALGQTPPADHYTSSPRRYSGRLRSPEYDDDEVRRVRRSGEIKWRGELIYISQTLAGEPIGLEERADGCWAVSYGPVHLGVIDHRGWFCKPSRSRRRQ